MSRQIEDQRVRLHHNYAFGTSIVGSTDSCAIPCGEEEFRGNSRLSGQENRLRRAAIAAKTLSTTKSNSSRGAVPRSRIYFTDTKYVANISALRVPPRCARAQQSAIILVIQPIKRPPNATGWGFRATQAAPRDQSAHSRQSGMRPESRVPACITQIFRACIPFPSGFL